MTQQIVYLNGDFLPLQQAFVPVLDRGFIFGDGVYEVIPAYNNHLFRFSEHIQRLHSSLQAIGLEINADERYWRGIVESLLEHNGHGDWSVYLQITRGVAVRDHVFPPESVSPTVFAMCNPIHAQPEQLRQQGIKAVVLEDNRWQNCQIKAISLLPNVLLKQQAHAAGAQEAILVRDGWVTEGSASNVFIIKDAVLYTPPKSNHLLPGITRDLVVELAQKNQLQVKQEKIAVSQLATADEIWLTSSTKEIMAVTELDGQPVADGRPGILWAKMINWYQQYKQVLREGKQT